MTRNAGPEARLSAGRSRLAALREKKPAGKPDQIRALWPDIEAALEQGHSFKMVCDRLEADGIQVTPRSLAPYVSRIRRKSIAVDCRTKSLPANSQESATRVHNAAQTTKTLESKSSKSPDPLANIREKQAKRTAFDYRPELADPQELI
jgi:hypothetical protein